MAFDTRAALARAVAKLADSGLDAQELVHEAAARVRRVRPRARRSPEPPGVVMMDPALRVVPATA